MRTYILYFGYHKLSKELVYIGTTVQKPADRFRWHKANGKDLLFEVKQTFKTSEEMLDEEFRLIKLHKPKLNKNNKRKQNLNCKLTTIELDKRINNPEWCQKCLKRRTKNSLLYCFNCTNF